MLSVFQACDITGGIYLKVPHMPSLLQYLLVSHLKSTLSAFSCVRHEILLTSLTCSYSSTLAISKILCPLFV